MNPQYNVDVVGVFDQNFNQLFVEARPIKATILRDSESFTHPLETGATITDHRIIKPVEIELTQKLTGDQYRSTYQNIRSVFMRGDIVTVQTRVDTFASLLIEAMPHEETPEALDAVDLILRLKEAQFVTVQFQALPPAAVKRPGDASTVKKGQQNPQETNNDSLAVRGLRKWGVVK